MSAIPNADMVVDLSKTELEIYELVKRMELAIAILNVDRADLWRADPRAAAKIDAALLSPKLGGSA